MYCIKSKNNRQNAAHLRKEKGENNIIQTPEWLAYKIYDIGRYKIFKLDSNITILDPCCGNCILMQPFRSRPDVYDITEIDIRYNDMDFFKYSTDNKFDIIVMNPPFSRDKAGKNCWDWVVKAMEHLNDIGYLYAILPDYILFNSDHRKKQLSEWLVYAGSLPKNTFGFQLHTHLCIFTLCKNKTNITMDFIFEE